jgi:hypothetical protein
MDVAGCATLCGVQTVRIRNSAVHYPHRTISLGEATYVSPGRKPGVRWKSDQSPGGMAEQLKGTTVVRNELRAAHHEFSLSEP